MKWFFIGYPIAVFLATLGVIAAQFDYSETDWPAWTQAIGSIAALGVAIWVSADQHRKQQLRDRQREEDDVQGMLRSLRPELEAFLESAEKDFGPDLVKTEQGLGFKFIYPVADQPFKVYDAFVPKLGMVRDSSLRKQIVVTYAECDGFLVTVKYNNTLLETLQAIKQGSTSNQDAGASLVQKLEDELGAYAAGMKPIYANTMAQIKKLLAILPTD